MREAIAEWLAMHPPLALRPADDNVIKAGLVPFLPTSRREDWQFLVMRPRADKPELGPPPLQLCKGTRMQKTEGEWKDMSSRAEGWIASPAAHNDEGVEPLPLTALREGMEELGVLLEETEALYDLGNVSFASASTGKEKTMRLFAARMRSPVLGTCADTTAERRWVDIAEFALHGRADHVEILREVLSLLR